ncbi:MAG: ammonia-forming cytochrome c nitrite reductase subunit c552 [Bacillota bacterium]
MRKAIALVTVLAILALLGAATAYAKAAYVNSLVSAYPNLKGSKLAGCVTCHTSDLKLNRYGADLAAAGMDYRKVEGTDSDRDGFSNLAEIKALTFPGDPTSKPAASQPTTGGGSSGAPAAGGTTQPPARPALFRDIARHPAREAIETLAEAGVVKGRPGKVFAPDARVTRAEFAAMVERIFGLPEVTPYLPAFGDAPKDAWYWKTVETVVRAGLMAPAGQGAFGTGDGVTRVEAARVAVKALGLEQEAQALPDVEKTAVLGKLADGASIPADSAGYVAVAIRKGLFPAEGRFEPSRTFTRADAAVLLVKVWEGKKGMQDPLAGVASYVVGPEQCATCHSEAVAAWRTTMHSRMVQEPGPGVTNANFADPRAGIQLSDVKFVVGGMTKNYFVGADYKYLPAGWDIEKKEWQPRAVSPWLGACTGCHTTGYDKQLNTFVSLGISCESCHGPGSKHVATGGNTAYIKTSLDVDACESCHGGDRQVGQLKQTGHYSVFANMVDKPFYKESCMECHSATVRLAEEKGQPVPTLTDFREGDLKGDRVGITCVVCHDPHKRDHEAQLRKDAQETCIECHTGELKTETFAPGTEVHHAQKEMWLGVGAIGVPNMPAAKTATCVDCHMVAGNHFFKAGTPKLTITQHGKPVELDSCDACHKTMTGEKTEGLHQEFDRQVKELKDLLARVDARIKDRQAMGLYVKAAQELRDKAFTNISFAEADASGGIHNPGYTNEMLRVARQWLQEALTR